MSEYCTLYIARHGLSAGNILGINQGQKDYPLTPDGEKQAGELSKILSSVEFSAIYSSDLLRARRTAEIIAEERKIALNTTKLLRERRNGKYEGELNEELKAEFQNWINLFKRQTKQNKWGFRFGEGAESNEDLMKRFIPFLREVSAIYPNKNVLMISHGGIIKAFLIHLGYADIEDGIKLGNTGYIKVLCDGTDFIFKDIKGAVR